MKKTSNIILGIALVICCIIGYGHLHDKVLIPRYVMASLCLLMLFSWALFRKKKGLLPNTPVLYLYLLFTLLCCSSILWATNLAESLFAASTTLMGFLATMVFYTLLSKNETAFMKTIRVSGAIILMIYLLFTLDQLLGIHDFSFGQLYQVTGINEHKNLLSIMLFMLSAFLLTSIPEIKHKKLKYTPIALFIFTVALLALLKSRAVLLSIGIAALCYLLLLLIHRRTPTFKLGTKVTTTLITILLAFGFFTIILRSFAARSVPKSSDKSEVEYSMLSTSSLVERTLLWDKTYHIADKKPLLGYGAGNWQIHFPEASLEGLYRADLWNQHITKPHNEYLGILAECGYLGLFLYLAFLCSLIILSFFALCETKDRKEFYHGALSLCILIAGSVNAAFDYPNSRIEFILWNSVIVAHLLKIISRRKPSLEISHGWNALLLSLSAAMLTIGVFRFHGEQKSVLLQQAFHDNEWTLVDQYSTQALSCFYTIDPDGLPLHWYQGKAEKAMDNPLSITHFREACHDAPYCKENLNDLGLEEYHLAHNPESAIHAFEEAIRISPNYLYPYFNLAYLYLDEGKPEQAKAIVDRIYMDEQKRDILLGDIPFFEPDDIEASKKRIENDFQTTNQLRAVINTILNIK